jgi:hypothetical protein
VLTGGIPISVVVLVATTIAAQLPAPMTADEVLRALTSSVLAERSRAVVALTSEPSLAADGRIRAALFDEVRTIQKQRFARAIRIARGEIIEGDEATGEYYLSLLAVVRALRDPLAIPVLVEAAGTGSGVARALAAFGDRAVPAVVTAWRERSDRDATALKLEGLPSGLLRAMTRMAVDGGLSPANQALMTNTLAEVIRMPDDAIVLRVALESALELRDPGLLMEVEKIAADVGEVYRRGVQDPDLAEGVQRIAREGLAKLR